MSRKRIESLSPIAWTVILTVLFSSIAAYGLPGQWEPGKDTDVFHLSNGLKIIFQNNEASKITVCQILIRGGKRAEPAGKEGLAYMTTRLTLEFPDLQTFQNMMDQATELNIAGRMDYSQINIACLSENFAETAKLISHIMLDPLFSSIRIDSIKKLMLRTKDIQGDDPQTVAHQTVLDTFFSGTPYSVSPYGAEESLKAIKRRDVDTFYEENFRASNMVFAVSSDLSRPEIQGILEKCFVEIPSGKVERQNENIAVVHPEERTVSIAKETQQSLIMAAFPLPSISERNYILANLLYYAIGHGANSQLWPLRVEQKLAYNVNSRLDLFAQAGVLEAYLETDSENEVKAQGAMQKILSDLFEKGMTEEELETTQAYYTGAFLRQIESKEGRTQTLIEFEGLGLEYRFLDRIFDEIDATSLEEINGFIKANLTPEKRLDLVVGPQETLREFR